MASRHSQCLRTFGRAISRHRSAGWAPASRVEKYFVSTTTRPSIRPHIFSTSLGRPCRGSVSTGATTAVWWPATQILIISRMPRAFLMRRSRRPLGSSAARTTNPLRIFFFNDTATTEIYTLSLHDALPISQQRGKPRVLIVDWDVHHGNGDRKSTRLNSSHSSISYAVFCLKKKKKTFAPYGRISPTYMMMYEVIPRTKL